MISSLLRVFHKVSFLGAVLVITACGDGPANPTQNSNPQTPEEVVVTPPATEEETPVVAEETPTVSEEEPTVLAPVNSEKALAILESQCSNCHWGAHDDWQAFETDQAWLDATSMSGEQLIDLSDPEHSLLVERMTFYGEEKINNMPLTNNNQPEEFTEADYLVLVEWAKELASSKTELEETEQPPATEEETPVEESEEETPAPEVENPVVEETPQEEEEIPVVVVETPSEEEETPVVEETPPTEEEPGTVEEETPTTNEEETPIVEETPVEEEQEPVAEEETPETEEQPPVAEEEPPVTDEETPVTEESNSENALAILANQCSNCHMTIHDPWQAYDSDEAWVSALGNNDVPLIDLESPEDSLLLQRISFYGGANSNMPYPNTNQPEALTEAEYLVLVQWANELAAKEATPEEEPPVAEEETSTEEEQPVVEETPAEEEETPVVEETPPEEEETPVVVEENPVNYDYEPVTAETALAILDDQCSSCHFESHKAWRTFTTEQAWLDAEDRSGNKLIDLDKPEDSPILQRIFYYGAPNSNMPVDNPNQTEEFTEEHYVTLRNWAIGLADQANPSSDKAVKISEIQFDETGLNFTAECETSQTLSIGIDGVDTGAINLSEYTEVYAEAGDIFLSMDSIATSSEDNVELIGTGIDFWESAIYFNGLQKAVDEDLDITITVNNVDNVQHAFAKVGILVSSTEGDISGDMLFLHWAGRAGIAQDWGTGRLNGYRQMIDNANRSGQTPTPATLRLALVDGIIKVGGCFGCSTPELQFAETTFTPKTVFIAAGAHAEEDITANITIDDAFAAPNEDVMRLVEQDFTCGPIPTTITINDAALDALSNVPFQISRDGELLAQFEQERTVSLSASCEMQEQLLEPKIRRLSEIQIENSIRDVFGNVFGEQEIGPQMGDGAKLIGMNFIADKLNINSLNFENMYESSRAIVTTLLSEHSEISECAAGSNASCVDTLLDEYGTKLWRRPLSNTEIDEFEAALDSFDSNQDKLEFMFNALLMSNQFLFRSEIGSNGNNIQALDNYELISLLSYTLWNSGPDDALMELAAQSTPITEAQLRTQVDRMFSDTRTSSTFVEIYKDYLKLELVLSREKADEFEFTDDVRQSILASAEMMIDDNLKNNAHFMDAFGGSNYFINDDIAPFFNTTADYQELTQTEMNSSERYGLLNHPAFLAVHSTLNKSGIVKRGVFTLEQLLCEELPDPPDAAMGIEPPDDLDEENLSERELLQITHSAQAACVGCHQTIDPAGFGFENFDAVGRFRTVEKDTVTIDASGVLNISGESLIYANSSEYSAILSDSTAMRQCVEKRFLEHYLGQELDEHSCEFQKFNDLVESSNGSVKDLILALIQLESFSTRAVGK